MTAASPGLRTAVPSVRARPSWPCDPEPLPCAQSLGLEDQIESGESDLKKLKAEENALRRLVNAKKEKLATLQFRTHKKHEDVKQYKQAVIQYGPLPPSAPGRCPHAAQSAVLSAHLGSERVLRRVWFRDPWDSLEGPGSATTKSRGPQPLVAPAG